jgi:hypothetical protein
MSLVFYKRYESSKPSALWLPHGSVLLAYGPPNEYVLDAHQLRIKLNSLTKEEILACLKNFERWQGDKKHQGLSKGQVVSKFMELWSLLQNPSAAAASSTEARPLKRARTSG